MKSPGTLRQELKRLRGMRARRGLTEEQRSTLFRSIVVLEWVLKSGTTSSWARPSLRIPDMDCRKGAP